MPPIDPPPLPTNEEFEAAQAADDARLDTLEAEDQRDATEDAEIAARVAVLEQIEADSPPSDDEGELSQEARLADLLDRVKTLEARPYGSGAYVGMPCTVIGNGTPPTDQAIQAGIKAWLDNRSGNFPRTHLILNWIGRATATTPLLKYLADNAAIPQIQGARIFGVSKRGTDLGWANSSVPLLTSDGDLRNFEFKDLTLTSTAALATPAKGLLFLSNADTGKTGSDGKFDSVEFMGAWDYGIALDGGATANLNSELICDQLAAGGSASFGRGLFVSGLEGFDAQEDQFLNYTFRDCKLEGSHGDYLVFNKGGSITIEGFNSWIHTGGQNGGVAKGTMLKMPVTSHFDSVQSLDASHIRAEIRGVDSKFMDCGWSSGARLTFDTLDTGAWAFKSGFDDVENITLRNGAHVHLLAPSLGGYIALRDKGGYVEVTDPKNVYGRDTISYSVDGTGNSMVRNLTGTTQLAPKITVAGATI